MLFLWFFFTKENYDFWWNDNRQLYSNLSTYPIIYWDIQNWSKISFYVFLTSLYFFRYNRSICFNLFIMLFLWFFFTKEDYDFWRNDDRQLYSNLSTYPIKFIETFKMSIMVFLTSLYFFEDITVVFVFNLFIMLFLWFFFSKEDYDFWRNDDRQLWEF